MKSFCSTHTSIFHVSESSAIDRPFKQPTIITSSLPPLRPWFKNWHAHAASHHVMSCHVTSPSSLCDGWLRGWVSADQRPLSRAMRSRLAPDWSVHATMLSIQHVLGLPRFLVPDTRPVITLPSMLKFAFCSSRLVYLFMEFSTTF